jgi:hypothetical protein
MRCLLLCFLFISTLIQTALGADSVVLGKGINNAYIGKLPCLPNEICLDAMWVWTFEAERTLAGPPIKGTVRIFSGQDASATDKFIKSVELFVIRPIKDPKLRKITEAHYELVSLSALHEDGSYCISEDPNRLGLRLQKSQIHIDSSGYYCLKKGLIVGSAGL